MTLEAPFQCSICGGGRHDLVASRVRDWEKLECWNPSVVRCRECRTVQLHPIEDPDGIDFYRANRQFRHAFDQEEVWNDYWRRTRIDAERRLRFVQALLPPESDSTLLEIGCGFGAFLKKASGLYPQAIGIEPGAERANLCSQLHGLPVINEFFDRHDFGHSRFDLICAFHVFEHIAEPLPFLRRVRNHLAENGRLVMEVPNHGDLMIKLSKSYRAFHYQSAHKFYYTAATIQSVVKQVFSRADVVPVQRYAIENHLHWLKSHEPELAHPTRVGQESAGGGVYPTMLEALRWSDTLMVIASA